MVKMSFAQEVKKELCALPVGNRQCAIAESYGVFLFANIFRADEIRIITVNEEFSFRLKALVYNAFGINIEMSHGGEGSRFVFRIYDQMQLFHIFETLGVDPDSAASKINFSLLEDDECRSAFLRGAFLSGASVADPAVRYHLEFTTPYLGFSGAMRLFFTYLHINPRVTTRAGKYVIYFKSSESIEDILAHIGAHHSSLSVMQTKVVKEVRNGVNRYVNCETANITKTVAAAQIQTQAIKRLEEEGKLNVLPRELKETAIARIENPEASLSALGQLLVPPVSRATVNYRLKKLIELSDKEDTE